MSVMSVTFDQSNMNSWYFGGMSRAQATHMLMSEKENGVFLVRDSNTIQGNYVLCVREDGRVSHYIINRVLQDGATRYRIGDQLFTDIPALLNFYRLHYLDSTPLVRPLSAPPPATQITITQNPSTMPVIETVMAKYDFDGNDTDDLPFRKGEILEVICKDEEQWWTARNRAGNTGSIPVPYITRYVETTGGSNVTDAPTQQHNNTTNNHDGQHTPTNHGRTSMQRALPAFARVKQARVPNAYDKTALRLERGDIIKVTKTNINGQWEGELNGRVGHFPFTHVEFLDDIDSNNTANS